MGEGPLRGPLSICAPLRRSIPGGLLEKLLYTWRPKEKGGSPKQNAAGRLRPRAWALVWCEDAFKEHTG
jgi:hypothetical protein